MTPLEAAKKHANMMNAAPDMYDALKEAREELREITAEFYGENHNSPQINAALAKAEGNQ